MELTISEFSQRAGVTKQAIYKQVHKSDGQLAPYIIMKGNRTFIDARALKEVYQVEQLIQPKSTEEVNQIQPNSTKASVDPAEETTQVEQPIQPDSTKVNLESQPVSTDYIAFLKSQVEKLQEEKQHLNETIQAKDQIIKQQSDQLSDLASQVARIAQNAITTTAQQQYLTAVDKAQVTAEEPKATAQTAVVTEPKPEKEHFWSKWFK